MQTLDWIVLISTLLLIVVYGTYQSRGSKNVQDYLKGGNTSKWYTIGLSVMATQASAITFLSTPGQAFNDGWDLYSSTLDYLLPWLSFAWYLSLYIIVLKSTQRMNFLKIDLI
jgi:Na+/proline symporter